MVGWLLGWLVGWLVGRCGATVACLHALIGLRLWQFWFKFNAAKMPIYDFSDDDQAAPRKRRRRGGGLSWWDLLFFWGGVLSYFRTNSLLENNRPSNDNVFGAAW